MDIGRGEKARTGDTKCHCQECCLSVVWVARALSRLRERNYSSFKLSAVPAVTPLGPSCPAAPGWGSPTLCPRCHPCSASQERRELAGKERGRAAQTQHPPAPFEPVIPFIPITHSSSLSPRDDYVQNKGEFIHIYYHYYHYYFRGGFFLGIPGMEGVKVIISSMSTASPHPAELHQSSRGSGSGDFTSQPRAVPDCWSLLICVFSLEACWFNHFKDAHFFQARDFMTLRIRSCYPNKPWSSIYSDFMVSFTNKLFKTYVNCVYCIL